MLKNLNTNIGASINGNYSRVLNRVVIDKDVVENIFKEHNKQIASNSI